MLLFNKKFFLRVLKELFVVTTYKLVQMEEGWMYRSTFLSLFRLFIVLIESSDPSKYDDLKRGRQKGFNMPFCHLKELSGVFFSLPEWQGRYMFIKAGNSFVF